ncbi:PTS lactose/cellobiose transporter subunit IIA [Clostridium tarantellae]|uniref:PTS lactose/cellobiose transporter subunit IIA n=1 Tax=Clostridium tarantellae TaxID=39493 RepID=A0A6I1MRS2_9CLOT|nr:PTS lactose/cellobiose transporter subunit IIA [Clostridium tarantellae]MPQ44892.1 PTS lactose/cellobiose transporter subunit IIA [Clostridium tarantellae]
MDEKILEISFQIIAFAGNARSIATEAIREAKSGNIEQAKELLKQSKEEMHEAHKFQTELIQKEAAGEKYDIGVLLIHSQDHLMNAITYQSLAEEIVDLYERLLEKN